MLTTDNHNLRLTHFLWSSTHMTHFNSLFLTLVVLITFFLPVSARAEQWEDPKVGPFTLGYWQKLDAGAVTVETAAAGIVANFQACEKTYGKSSCYIQFKASTDVNHYENVENGRDSAWEGGLGSGRVNILKQAVYALDPSIAEYAVDELVLNHRESGFRYAWAVIKPKAGALRLADLKPACSDGKDNDNDGLIDMDDPGCTDPSDNDERNPRDINKLWGRYVVDVMRESDNACPGTITFYGDYRTPTKTGFDCSRKCSLHDVDLNRPGGQVYADTDWISLIQADKAEWTAANSISWTDMVAVFSEGFSSRVDEVNSSKNDHYTVDGLSVTFVETLQVQLQDGSTVDTMTVIFPDRTDLCEDTLQAEHNEAYTGVDFILAANGTLGSQAVGMGNSIQQGPFGMATLEVGLEAGGPNGAFFGTVGVGGWFDDNCASTAAWLGTVRLGATIGRSNPVGALIDVRGLVSYGPSVSIEVTPDDPTTTEIEYAETEVPAWGINTLGFMVEGGPRIAFGRGVHNGWIAPMATVGPVQRWVYQPDGSLGTTVTADVGISVFGGFAF